MGLKVSTISRLPAPQDRDYFIYFLDYGWDEPLSNAMYANFDRLAAFAADHRSLVIAGLHRQEFANEVLSWHRVNGDDANELLPALMITDADPQTLAATNEFAMARTRAAHPGVNEVGLSRFLIVPLRDVCKTPSDVTMIFEKLMRDISARNPISDFQVARTVDRTTEGLAEMLVLRPSVGGVGVDLKKVWEFGSKFVRQRLGS